MLNPDWILAWRLQEAYPELSVNDMASHWAEQRRHGYIQLHPAWVDTFARGTSRRLYQEVSPEDELEQMACELELDYAPISKLSKQMKKQAYEGIALLDEDHAKMTALEDIPGLFQCNATLGTTLQDTVENIRNLVLHAPSEGRFESVREVAAAVYDEEYHLHASKFSTDFFLCSVQPEAYDPRHPSFNLFGQADLLKQSHGITIRDVYDMPRPDNDLRFVVTGSGMAHGQFQGEVFLRKEVILLDKLIQDSFLFKKREVIIHFDRCGYSRPNEVKGLSKAFVDRILSAAVTSTHPSELEATQQHSAELADKAVLVQETLPASSLTLQDIGEGIGHAVNIAPKIETAIDVSPVAPLPQPLAENMIAPISIAVTPDMIIAPLPKLGPNAEKHKADTTQKVCQMVIGAIEQSRHLDEQGVIDEEAFLKQVKILMKDNGLIDKYHATTAKYIFAKSSNLSRFRRKRGHKKTK